MMSSLPGMLINTKHAPSSARGQRRVKPLTLLAAGSGRNCTVKHLQRRQPAARVGGRFMARLMTGALSPLAPETAPEEPARRHCLWERADASASVALAIPPRA